MNKLPTDKRVNILSMLTEGMSMRAVARVTGVSFNTVAKLLMEAADAADAYHDEKVRGITGRRHIQCDEIWSFIRCKDGTLQYAKAAPAEAGDSWTWTAIDSDSKLVVSYKISSGRDGQVALDFIDDLHRRLVDRSQLSTDGLKVYREALDEAFGSDMDYAQVMKESGNHYDRKYSAGTYTGMEKHAAMLALYFFAYNHVRPHRSVCTERNNRITPAMATGIADRPATLEQLVEMMDARAPKPNRPKTYRKKSAVSN